MRKQSLHLDNLGEVLAASPDSLKRGSQQFETPPDIAAALCSILPKDRHTIADFQCGHGNLLRAAANHSTRNLLGIDIDPTAHCRIPKGDDPVAIKPETKVIIADTFKLFSFLQEVNAKFDLLVLNPPFSLRIPSERLEGIHGMPDGPMIDSTLATYLMALDRLTKFGEGMMICNDATARRLILPRDESGKIWLHVVLPNFFADTIQQMDIAVLYFAKDHRSSEPPHELRIEHSNPGAIIYALAGINRRKLIIGANLESNPWFKGRPLVDTVQPFEAVADEWKRLKDEEKGKRQWNIALQPNGKINAWLTPFENLSGKAPRDLVEELQSLNGKRPMELVVTRDSREAMRRAVEGGIWRVQPELQKAVAEAIAAYNAIRAPFVRLNPVQRLGYLDEHDSILCTAPFDGFVKGTRYPLRSETIDNVKMEERKQPDSKLVEEVQVSGQELMFCIQDGNNQWHSFTQHEIDHRDGIVARHDLPTLLANFEIPDVPDVAEARPEVYHEFLNRLTALEAA